MHLFLVLCLLLTLLVVLEVAILGRGLVARLVGFWIRLDRVLELATRVGCRPFREGSDRSCLVLVFDAWFARVVRLFGTRTIPATIPKIVVETSRRRKT